MVMESDDKLVPAVGVVGQLREKVGGVIGRGWAPAVAAISRARRARMFHPSGHTFEGRVEAIATGRLVEISRRLEGRVLARCSGALWKHPIEHFDVLGIALRFRQTDQPFDAAAEPGDQDLLLATIVSPLTMPLSPLTTNTHDFLANTYYGTAPFALARRLRVKLRLRPLHRSGGEPREESRDDRLRDAVNVGRAVFALEARRTLAFGWYPLVRITLEREVDLDQAALRFDPFRTGAGLAPVGLVHAIRRSVYSSSQAARPTQSPSA
jgi:hypothetical protein